MTQISERRRTAPVLLGIASVVLVADQATKAVALATLSPGATTPVIDGVFHWTLQRNPGAAFGLFGRFPIVFTILALMITVGILLALKKVPDTPHAVALGLILGGADGNLVDRLVRDPGFLRGEVVDFIDLRVWPVFNIADSAIVCGAILLVIANWRAERAARTVRASADD